MEGNRKQVWGAFLLGVLLPSMLMRAPAAAVTVPTESVPLGTQATQPLEYDTGKAGQRVPVLVDGSVLRLLELEDYLIGVVLGEMPAEFAIEALKAQAVVARTYTLRSFACGAKHPGGAVCTDSTCCQAYYSQETYLADGGSREAVDRVREAVLSTQGQVVTYEGVLIEATYFACSGGRTEDAVAVWGTEIPYLQSVESPGEEGASSYMTTVSFSPDAFQNLLGLRLSGNPKQWLGPTVYTEGGGVATMVIGGKEFTGVQLRKLLDLNSTAFVLSANAQEVRLTVLGHGHRVGMSQYGADAMAVRGNSYAQILSYYYPGTRIDKIDSLE